MVPKLLIDLRLIYLGAPKVSGTRLSPEDAECIRFADACRGWLVTEHLQGMFLHVPNEFAGAKRYVFGAVMQAMGKIAGAPDYLFLFKGGCACIEFKRPDGKGKQSEKQAAFERLCRHYGIPYYLVNTANAAEAALVELGVLKGDFIKIPHLAPVGKDVSGNLGFGF